MSHARASTGWHEPAAQWIYHQLLRDAKSQPELATKAAEQSHASIQEMRRIVSEDGSLSAKKKLSILRNYSDIESWLADGNELPPRVWYAVSRLLPTTQQYAIRRDQILGDHAAATGQSFRETRKHWNRHLRETPAMGRGRREPHPGFYGLPGDPATLYTLGQMGVTDTQDSSTPWTETNSPVVVAFSYQEDTQTASIVTRSQPHQALNFYIPTAEWQSAVAGSVEKTLEAGLATHAWPQLSPTAVSRCKTCGQFATVQGPHRCPELGTTPSDPQLWVKYKTLSCELATQGQLPGPSTRIQLYDTFRLPVAGIVDGHTVEGEIVIGHMSHGTSETLTSTLNCGCGTQGCAHTLELQAEIERQRIHPQLDGFTSSFPTSAPQHRAPIQVEPRPVPDQIVKNYQQDAVTARIRHATNGPPLEFVPSVPATHLGTQRNFGLEIEVDAPPGADPDQWRTHVTHLLHNAGITQQETPLDYEHSKSDYTNDPSSWRTVLDSSCDLEIVSPILSDTPAAWTTVNNVTSILKAAGATTSTRTGLHVHVSAPDYTANGHPQRLIQMIRHHEDLLVRLATDTETGTHRGSLYCGPNATITAAHLAGTAPLTQPNRDIMVNLAHLRGTPQDRIEWRLWDGALDPGTIQARTALSIALTSRATKSWTPTTPGALLGERHGVATPNDDGEGVHELQDLLHNILPDRVHHRKVVELFALTPWQEPNN